MKRFSEQFKKQADKTRLSNAERADLRERVMAYMEYHPLPSTMRAPQAPVKADALVSQPYIGLPINWFYVRGFASAFAMLMVVVVPVAAEYTAPGDMLYNVKVNFNEEVRSTLTTNPYEKIEWETKRLERRIAEARLLESEGKLTEAVEAQVAEAVKQHTNTAKAQIATLRLTDQDEAAIAEIAFATALSVQSEVINKRVAQSASTAALVSNVSDTSTPSRSVLAALIASVSTEATAATAVSVPSYAKLMARVEQETTAAFELFATVKVQASGSEMENIERRLKDIERKVALANAPRPETAPTVEGDEVAATMMMRTMKVADDTTASTEAVADEQASTSDVTVEPETERAPETVAVPEGVSEAEAIEILRGVMSDLRKLISFMTDIDVRNSVSVEELVPMTPTPEERTQNVQAQVARIKEFTAAYGTSTFTGSTAEKVQAGVAEIVRFESEIELALSANDFATAEAQSARALSLLQDVTMLMNAATTSAPQVLPETPEAAEVTQ